MKLNKTKILIPSLAIVAGACLVGSVSGTVAWYQYSTRVTAAYNGAAAHCTENLQIRIRSSATDTLGKWDQDLTGAEIAAYLSAATDAGGANRTAATNTLRPVTSGELAAGAVATNLYKNPIYQYAEMSTWGAATATEDYILLPLELRVLDVNGNSAGSETFLAKNIYVSDVTIAAAADNGSKTDLSSAIRVGISAGTDVDNLDDYATFSTTGTDVNVYGNLDLNGDSSNDKVHGYDFGDSGASSRSDVMYGEENKVAASTRNNQLGTDATATTVGVANDTNPYSIKGKPIGATTASETLNVNVLIYLEGWQKISGNAIWDAASTIGAKFNVGIRFSCETHAANE